MNHDNDFIHLRTIVSNEYHIEPWKLYIRTRKREIVFPRQVLMALTGVALNYGSSCIGREFHLVHATVIHAGKQVARQYRFNRAERKHIDAILHEAYPDINQEIVEMLLEQDI